MDSTRPVNTNHGAAAAPARAMVPPVAAVTVSRAVPEDHVVKGAGYGLPCAKCRAYYPADMKACPICKTAQRVSPKAAVSVRVTSEPPVAESPALEQERERFLREFQAQMNSVHSEMGASGLRCNLEENHMGEFEAAEVCQGCYNALLERADLMEAALHMEVKEAAQIVYDAVWADTSDTTKTYLNAAQALLMELRKRAGIKTVRGPLQPLPH